MGVTLQTTWFLGGCEGLAAQQLAECQEFRQEPLLFILQTLRLPSSQQLSWVLGRQSEDALVGGALE